MLPGMCGMAQVNEDESYLNKAAIFLDQGEFESYEALDSQYRLLLSAARASTGSPDTMLPQLILHYADIAGYMVGAGKWLEILKEAGSMFDSIGTVSQGITARHMIFLVNAYRWNSQVDSIEIVLNEMELMFANVDHPSAEYMRWLYEKARFSYDRADYEACLIHLTSSLDYLNKHYPENLERKILIMNAMGISYRRKNQPREAVRHLHKVLDFVDSTGMNHQYGTVANNLGLSYRDIGDYVNAIKYMSAAIENYLQIGGPAAMQAGTGYDNIAQCYLSLGDLAEAENFSEKAIDFISNRLSEEHPDMLVPLNTLTDIHLRQGDLDKAYAVNERANDLVIELGWTIDDPNGSYILEDVFGTIGFRTKLYRNLYDESGDPSMLDTAIIQGRRFIATTDYAYDHLKSSISRDIFIAQYEVLFTLFIDNLLLRFERSGNVSDVDSAFYISEKFKALELLYAAQQNKADQTPRYKALNAEQSRLLDSIDHYEVILGNAVPDSARIKAKLVKAQENLLIWKDQVRREYPNYYELIYHPEPFGVDALAAELSVQNMSLLSYHVGLKELYIFHIDSAGH